MRGPGTLSGCATSVLGGTGQVISLCGVQVSEVTLRDQILMCEGERKGEGEMLTVRTVGEKGMRLVHPWTTHGNTDPQGVTDVIGRDWGVQNNSPAQMFSGLAQPRFPCLSCEFQSRLDNSPGLLSSW